MQKKKRKYCAKGKVRKCRRCGETNLIKFNNHPNTWDGLQPYCKECDKKRLRKLYMSDLERNREKRRKWQEKNRKKHNKHVRDYYKRKREKPEIRLKNK
jgi:hypothetical protein